MAVKCHGGTPQSHQRFVEQNVEHCTLAEHSPPEYRSRARTVHRFFHRPRIRATLWNASFSRARLGRSVSAHLHTVRGAFVQLNEQDPPQAAASVSARSGWVDGDPQPRKVLAPKSCLPKPEHAVTHFGKAAEIAGPGQRTNPRAMPGVKAPLSSRIFPLCRVPLAREFPRFHRRVAPLRAHRTTVNARHVLIVLPSYEFRRG